MRLDAKAARLGETRWLTPVSEMVESGGHRKKRLEFQAGREDEYGAYHGNSAT